jgi:hypothetical protein
MNHINKHIIDCGIAFFIAFFSSILSTDVLELQTIFISIAAASLIALIKFREFWTGEIVDKKTCKVHTIFY